MRYKYYVRKDIRYFDSYSYRLVHDTKLDNGIYLYVGQTSTDYFSFFLESTCDNPLEIFWDFSYEIKTTRLELEHYNLIEEFDNPKDSVVIKEEYENILFMEELKK